ncbi:MAG: RNA polymerase subunit sigma-24 [Eubacteriales bacterium]
MKNYNKSDYALNKVSEHIVYRFADSIVEVTMEDYLRQNPDKTEEDFRELKALSDEMYHQDVIIENRTTRDNVSITGLEETITDLRPTPLQELIHNQDGQAALEAAYQLLEGRNLTEKQKRRFIQHFFHNRSLRQIADDEGVHFTSVDECIHRAIGKLKNIFSKK